MKSFTRHLFTVFTFTLLTASIASAQKLKADEVVAKHLESIGTADARGAAKSMVAVGDAVVTFISQKNQTAQGRIVMASTGPKNFIGLQLNAVDYPGEKFSYDGNKAKVALVLNGKRSFFGNFVSSNEAILKESLMGGTLSLSWALSNAARKGKLSAEGIKKIDGREYYVLGYSPKGGSDIDVALYFDKETFRHTRTEYKYVSSAGIGATIDQSARQSETRLKVTEDYADFKDFNGLTLPQKYKVNYTITGANGTTEVEWAYAINEVEFNKPLDDKTFDADAN